MRKNISILFFLFIILPHNYAVCSENRSPSPIKLNGLEIDIAGLSKTQSMDIRTSALASVGYALAQFNAPTSPIERKNIEKLGIEFLYYIPTNAYIVSGEWTALNALKDDVRIAGLIPIPSEAKLDMSIREAVEVEKKTPRSDSLKSVKILFFPGTSFEQAQGILKTHGAVLNATQTGFDFRQTIDSVSIPPCRIQSLAEEDSVFLIMELDPPVEPTNVNAADTSNVDEIQPGGLSGYGLDGTGVSVGIWDVGPVRLTHEQIQGRATQEDTDAKGEYHDHASHIAGTIAGSGAGNPLAKGMAPNATLLCWLSVSDLGTAEVNAHRISVSNHAYASSVDSIYGAKASPYSNGNRYDSRCQGWDAIAADHGLIIVRSAGNDRSPSSPVQYKTVISPAVAKNLITVGAVEDLLDEPPIPIESSMTSYSSWGPADDGRIKPGRGG